MEKATSCIVLLCDVPSDTFTLSEMGSFQITLLCTASNRPNHYGKPTRC